MYLILIMSVKKNLNGAKKGLIFLLNNFNSLLIV